MDLNWKLLHPIIYDTARDIEPLPPRQIAEVDQLGSGTKDLLAKLGLNVDDPSHLLSYLMGVNTMAATVAGSDHFDPETKERIKTNAMTEFRILWEYIPKDVRDEATRL